jgi:hypothetical protein
MTIGKMSSLRDIHPANNKKMSHKTKYLRITSKYISSREVTNYGKDQAE